MFFLLSSITFSAMVEFPHFRFPQGAATEQIVLRWVHFVAGIIWIGLLYFFNLVGFPTMKALEASVRGKVFPVTGCRGRCGGSAGRRW